MRGPNRSTAGPDTPPKVNSANVVSEKATAVAPRPAPSSSLTGSRNAPKEYAIPNVVNIAANAIATARQPSAPSSLGGVTAGTRPSVPIARQPGQGHPPLGVAATRG